MGGIDGSSVALNSPAYTVRVSSRARRVRLVMRADTGLEVVIPRGFSHRRIPELLESKRAWIERAAARTEARRRRLEADPPSLPERIALAALDEEWQVEYLRRPGSRVGVREKPGRRLVVAGETGDFEACQAALCRWLGRRARRTLLLRLAVLSRQLGLAYTRATIRQQRTRWGSCSPKRAISLNARLLFLPRDVVDYVLVHELCHTVELNHSPRFWALVESHHPEYRAHKKFLGQAQTSLPTWLDGSAGGPVV